MVVVEMEEGQLRHWYYSFGERMAETIKSTPPQQLIGMLVAGMEESLGHFGTRWQKGIIHEFKSCLPPPCHLCDVVKRKGWGCMVCVCVGGEGGWVGKGWMER